MGARNRGSAYLLVLVVGVTLGAAAFAAFTLSVSRNRGSETSILAKKSHSVAEGASESVAKQLMDAIATYDYANVPSGGSPITRVIDADGLDVNCTLSEANVDQQITTDSFGVQTILKQYSIVASTSQADPDSPLAATPQTVTTVYEILQTPLFQFAVFYANDLEILPGPSMTLSGRIHSNADMYIGTNGTLSVDTNYVRSAGAMYRNRKDGTMGTMPGTVRVKDNTGAYVNWTNSTDSESATWYQQALDNWGDGTLSTPNDTVMSDVHGVTALSTPQVQNMAPGGYYHDEANNASGVVIEYIGGTPKILVDGVDVTTTVNTLGGGTIVASGQMADNRESTSQYIPVYDVDMSRMKTFIAAYYGTASHPEKFSGLMYAYRTDTTAAIPRGFRFKNAGMLPQPGVSHASAEGGLTIVSPDPVYLQKDYNSGTTSYNGSENLANKVPAAVIADAVSLLSNAWTNSKTPGGSLPTASTTVYNTAIIAGNVPTPSPGGGYGGGLENMPRFHENWTGKTAKFRGAFVSLFDSQYADGAWVYGGNRYTAPTRDWNYDTDFNNVNNLPPYTPMAVGMSRQVYTSTD